jgi:hypothetical protein
MAMKWGYILGAPGRPSVAEQERVLRALGLSFDDFGPVWRDVVPKLSTRPWSQLEGRRALLGAVQSGDTVVFAEPFCLGASAKDARAFLDALAERGVTALVNGGLRQIAPGDDVSEIVAAVASRQNVTAVRASEARAKKRRKPGV